MQQVQPRCGALRLQPDGHARTAWRDRLAAGVSPGKYDAIRRGNFEHFAHHFHRVWVTNVNLPACVRFNGRAGAPPFGPALAIGKIPEHGLARSLNLHRSVDFIFEIHAISLSSLSGVDAAGARAASLPAPLPASGPKACRPTSVPTFCLARLAPPGAPDKTDFCFSRASESVPLSPAIEAGAKPLRTSRPAWPGESPRRFVLPSKPAAGFRGGGAKQSRPESQPERAWTYFRLN